MNSTLLRTKLDSLYRHYDRSYLHTDPLMFPHRYSKPEDIEVVALVCASLAYGPVKVIQQSIERVLGRMGKHPAKFVRSFDAESRLAQFSTFTHRFNRGPDIVLLLHYIKQMLDTEGTIGDFFRLGYSRNACNIADALAGFAERTLALDCTPVYPDALLPGDAGVRFFFPSPVRRSACKRLNLFLRWMVRQGDGLDFGLWDFVSPSQLVIPVDTHVARICQRLGLTARESPGWSMAVEITENLKRLDPRDPVKYDFAISRLGILSKCPNKPLAHTCAECEIRKLCIR